MPQVLITIRHSSIVLLLRRNQESLRRFGASETRCQGGDTMSLGPIELLVIKFPGNQFRGEIAPALLELVDSGTIRVVELMVVSRDADGTILMADISDLGDG